MQQRTTRPIRILILALLLLVALLDIAVLVYMSSFLGLMRTPLQALPPLYWVLLLIPVMVAVVCALIIAADTSRGSAASNSNIPYLAFGHLHLILTLGFSGFSFLMAFVNNLTQPQWGGITAIFLTAACIKLIVGYGLYKQSQVLK